MLSTRCCVRRAVRAAPPGDLIVWQGIVLYRPAPRLAGTGPGSRVWSLRAKRSQRLEQQGLGRAADRAQLVVEPAVSHAHAVSVHVRTRIQADPLPDRM